MVNESFPRMMEVRQSFPPPRQLDLPRLVREQFATKRVLAQVRPGMRVAVGVGSRGITNLAVIVRAVLDALREAGAQPFVIPAMGSHGGGTSEGQTQVLAEYGVTAESMGVPIAASMETRSIGSALGADVHFSAAALEAEGIVIINRVKPHTDFHGTLGSGIQKMLTIGFGKHAGAIVAHRTAAHVGHERVIREFSRVMIETVPVLCGVAILEDQHHATAEIEVLRREEIACEEDRLFQRAWSLMPRLPLEEVDLLIVDRLGKEISGTGMDTNVIGREIAGYSVALQQDPPRTPMIHRIFVRGLSKATNGNGIGIGLADFTTARAVRALDLRYTYVNALTGMGMHPAKIPIHFETDREAIEAALSTLALPGPQQARILRIADTLSLEKLHASEGCADLLRQRAEVSSIGAPFEMCFDETGNLHDL